MRPEPPKEIIRGLVIVYHIKLLILCYRSFAWIALEDRQFANLEWEHWNLSRSMSYRWLAAPETFEGEFLKRSRSEKIIGLSVVDDDAYVCAEVGKAKAHHSSLQLGINATYNRLTSHERR